MEFPIPQNQQDGVWVWVPIPASDPIPTAATTEQYDSNMASHEPTNSFIASTGHDNPGLIPNLSNSSESFAPSPYQSPSPASFALNVAMDDFADYLLIPPLPIPSELDLGLNFELDLNLCVGGPIDLLAPTAAAAATFSDPNFSDQFPDWDLSSLDISSTPSSTSSSPLTPTISSQPTPARFPNMVPLLPLQSISPPPAPPTPFTPHRCLKCSKEYSTRGDLNKHALKHTKPHRCKLCDFTSAELRGLHRHMWTKHEKAAEETGVPKQIASCPKCAYTGRLDNLTRHMKRHSKIKQPNRISKR